MEISAPLQSSSGEYVPVAGRLHTTFLLVILGVWAFVGRIAVGRMQPAVYPHRMRSYLLTLLVEWLVFIYVVAGVRRRGMSALVVLGTRWNSFREVLRDIGIAAGFWLAAVGVLQVVARFLFAHTPRPNQEFLLPHAAGELAVWIALSISAGICEETIFRGYLQRQLIVFTKNVPAGILLTAAVFGAGHAYQGSRMTIVIAVYGLMFGLLAHRRGSVRPGMIAHAWQDSLSGLVRFLKLR
jgi:uncharacterized protein